MTKLAFTDCESTGLDPRVHGVWELAVILREPHVPDAEFLWQIRPSLDRADPESLKINRFHDRFAVPDGWDAVQIYEDGGQEKQHLHECLFEIQQVLRDAHVVGAVPSFDAAMLTALLQDRQRRIPWRYRLICVENLVAGALRMPLPIGLSKAAEAMGLPVDKDARHGGLYDARLARDVYDAVMAIQPASEQVAS